MLTRREKYKQFFTDKHAYTVGVTHNWSYGLMVAYAFRVVWITLGPLGFYFTKE